MKKILLFLICIFSVFCFAQASFSASEHYIERALSETGQAVIWPNKTISVYIAQSPYRSQVVSAFNAWQTSLSNLLVFNITTNPSSQIEVYFSSNLPKNTRGITSINRDENKIVSAQIRLMIPEKAFANTFIVYNAALHEIGHAIGIIGHSPNKNDVLYPEVLDYNKKLILSQRDIETVKWLYKVDQKVLDKHKDYLQSSKLEESIAYVKKFPNSTVGWNNLGNNYISLKQYDNAIWAYKKGIAINPNAFAIYKNLSVAYYYKNDKITAFNTANKAYTLSNQNLDYLVHLSNCIANRGHMHIVRIHLNQYVASHPSEKNSDNVKKIRIKVH